MSPLMAVFTFIVSWWIVLFIALPMGIEKAENPSKVEYAAAPKKIHWGKVLLLATVMALVFTCIIALIVHSGMIHLRDY